MKKFMTIFCCACLSFMGYLITTHNTVSVQQNAIHAANTSNWGLDGLKPALLQETKKDTVYVTVHDTVFVNNTKYVRIPVPTHTTDTLYIPVNSPLQENKDSVKQRNTVVQEDLPQEQVILLTVDGKVVYDSSDGLKEP